LDAVLGHELCHWGCRDNLTAALHRVVEATFWFQPGVRIERKRACEGVVGNDRQIYARSVLKSVGRLTPGTRSTALARALDKVK